MIQSLYVRNVASPEFPDKVRTLWRTWAGVNGLLEFDPTCFFAPKNKQAWLIKYYT